MMVRRSSCAFGSLEKNDIVPFQSGPNYFLVMWFSTTLL